MLNALQKAVFYKLKDGLLACNIRPFAVRKTVNRTPTPTLPKGGGLVATYYFAY